MRRKISSSLRSTSVRSNRPASAIRSSTCSSCASNFASRSRMRATRSALESSSHAARPNSRCSSRVACDVAQRPAIASYSRRTSQLARSVASTSPRRSRIRPRDAGNNRRFTKCFSTFATCVVCSTTLSRKSCSASAANAMRPTNARSTRRRSKRPALRPPTLPPALPRVSRFQANFPNICGGYARISRRGSANAHGGGSQIDRVIDHVWSTTLDQKGLVNEA